VPPVIKGSDGGQDGGGQDPAGGDGHSPANAPDPDSTERSPAADGGEVDDNVRIAPGVADNYDSNFPPGRKGHKDSQPSGLPQDIGPEQAGS
jgi:hypothetical protein